MKKLLFEMRNLGFHLTYNQKRSDFALSALKALVLDVHSFFMCAQKKTKKSVNFWSAEKILEGKT